MPPEGYERRRMEKIMNDFLNSLNSVNKGKSNHRRLSAREQVERIEMGRIQRYLSKNMIDYVKQYPN